ncbi:hypothetical protein FF47_59 [Mycobacterium phage FF47]|uniref:Uncharacterized protein n=1 Tax=Mycobacterium phage FF47 TaxID=1305710 RepID=M4W6T2_9CAUD|nr:hypothetical protein FF47_59 [Mycobacterium phage FF47]AGI12331.1 hypothetical protein FF47_59 [Mycobacterium phage FF47]
MKFSWKQPVCNHCWDGLKLKVGHPHVTPNARCCYCGRQIPSGEAQYIVQVNPGTVPYPSLERTKK